MLFFDFTRPLAKLLTGTFCILALASSAQTSGDSSAVHHIAFSMECDTCPGASYMIDTAGLALEGWWITHDKKRLWATHYKNGLEDGFWLTYSKRKKRYHLQDAGMNTRGYKSEFLQYEWMYQFIDSNTRSYGLLRQTLNWPYLAEGDTNHWRRELFYLYDSIQVADHFLDSIIYYKIGYQDTIHAPSWNHEIVKRFPMFLNENMNPFTKLRHDGYYIWHANLRTRS